MFKAINLFVLTSGPVPTRADLEAQLPECAFTPCAVGQAESGGWVPVHGDEDLVVEVAGWLFMRYRHQQRKVPAKALAEAVNDRCESLEKLEQEGPIRGARRREIRDQVMANLLATAPPQSDYIWLGWHAERHLIAVEGSKNLADVVLSTLRASLGSLPVVPAHFSRPIDGTLTTWLRHGEAPGLSIGQKADLQHPMDGANKVRFRGQPLDEDEVIATLERGLRVTSLELLWDCAQAEPMSFVISEDGRLTSVKIPPQELDFDEEETPETRLVADLFLVGSHVASLIDLLVSGMGELPAIERAA